MKSILLCIIAYLSCTTNITSVVAKNADYPKTIDEKRADEIGSVLGGEGIIFSPTKIKNESTKALIGSVNKYLWQSSIEILNFVPLASVDSNGGVIITEWYSPKHDPQSSFKINVLIKDTIIGPDAIEVKVFVKSLKNGHWIQSDQKSNLDSILEDKILRRARELYIGSERKE